MEKEQSFQPMVLEQQDIHIQKQKRIYTLILHLSQTLTLNESYT